MGGGLPNGRPRSQVDQAVKERAEIEAFVRARTQVVRPPLTPDIMLRLARDARGIFQDTDTFCDGTGWPPYWAFAWPGGQALARYVTDNPQVVDGRRVLDLGAGSGIAAIAAARAARCRVVAADPDPLASVAIGMNAAENGVNIDVVTEDVLGGELEADLVLLADLVYEPELATRVTRFLEMMRARGIGVIMADRTTAKRPAIPFELLNEVRAPLLPSLEESHFEAARLWKLILPGRNA